MSDEQNGWEPMTARAIHPKVELRHLSAFVSVAEASSFTRAAERLRITQPALSRTIAQLERRLNAVLLERSTHAVSLTTEGTNFLPYARNALMAVDEAVYAMQGGGVLRIGFTWSAAVDLTPMILKAFESSHPDVRVEFKRISDATAGIADGRSHVAFLRGEVDDSRFETVTLFEEERVAAFNLDHPLARRRSVRLADIETETLVVNTASGTTRPGLWGTGRKEREIFEVEGLEEWLEAIGLARGVGVTPESTRSLYPHPWIRYVPIEDAPRLPVLLAWPATRPHPMVADLIEIAQHYAQERLPWQSRSTSQRPGPAPV